MTAAAPRHTAVERREEIVAAAFAAFADTGYEGTSTDDIARAVGISQPYLFRLFGTKKQLFLAAVEKCLVEARGAFESAVRDGDPDTSVLERMGDSYVDVLRDRRRLRMQMQAYVACDDPEVRAVVQRGFGQIVDGIQGASDATPEQLSRFVAKGMLLNVMASMDALESTEPWAVALREGCLGPI